MSYYQQQPLRHNFKPGDLGVLRKDFRWYGNTTIAGNVPSGIIPAGTVLLICETGLKPSIDGRQLTACITLSACC